MSKDAPCISVCRYDGRTGWCLGCGRTVPEIRTWRKLTPRRRAALARELPRRVEKLAGTSAVHAKRSGLARKAVAVVVACVLALVSVMPLLLEARHEAHDAAETHAAVVGSHVGHEHAADHQEAGDLIHHAQSHAQGVMPAAAEAPASADGASGVFADVDHPDRGNGMAQGPFEPPKA